MSKKVLGLDLGTTSIGWAIISEADKSEVERIGVRVNPLTTEESSDFSKGKAVSLNADRTLKRGMRRNLDRYQLRRSNLIEILKEHQIIDGETPLTETGKDSTHTTWKFRANAVTEKIPLDAFARVLLSINKKRGYKSGRKVNDQEEGQIIDAMDVARRLKNEGITPGQLVYRLLKEGRKTLPDFYRSDLEEELGRIWKFQRQFHPEILTDEFRTRIEGLGQRATSASFWNVYGFNTAENKGSRDEKKLTAYEWRSKAVSEELTKEELAYVITEINNEINKSSGYLGAISDRSKELFFGNETIGQYLYRNLIQDPNFRMKGMTFYRQDYIDEFEKIWDTQAKHYPQLTEELKRQVRDVIIFYQRKLKSQKGLISRCEFESEEKMLEVDGRLVRRRIGLRVAPKSSPLFQEFKIWQVLGNFELKNKNTNEIVELDGETKQLLFDELNVRGDLSSKDALSLLGLKSSEWSSNYTTLEGNRTNKALFEAFLKILELEGYDEDLMKAQGSDEIDLAKIKMTAAELKEMVRSIFSLLGIETKILDFDAELGGKEYLKQPAYKLWHLLYSYEGDDSISGNDRLIQLLENEFGFKREHGAILAKVALVDDYGNLSSKAMRRIIPHLKDLKYDKACMIANYRHSATSLTKEEVESRVLKPKLDLLHKGELRNPVVEKILNQMVNVVNTLIDEENEKWKSSGHEGDFHFDEIRIELSRELKKSAKERAEATRSINAATKRHNEIFKILQKEFNIPFPSRNDIIRYKLYQELKNNGYRDLYMNQYIPRERLFSKDIDVDHIIPRMSLFDDSFSNKTIIFRSVNQEKGNLTAYDYISKKGEQALEAFLDRAANLYENNKKNSDEGISKAKFEKLQKKGSDLESSGFIERDLRDSQYIAKKAKDMLLEVTRRVVSTSGRITARLRDDWGLHDVIREINWDRYKTAGLIELIETKDGQKRERIVDWSKRDDHRHHAMDALTVAFTTHRHIHYLNNLNARRDEKRKLHKSILTIEDRITELFIDEHGKRKRRFKEPVENFRSVALKHLSSVLVSHKVKSKVVTKNVNKIKTRAGVLKKTELTPRGQLHLETVYGKYLNYESKLEKIGSRFDEDAVNKVINPVYKRLLKERLEANAGNPKLAFAGKNSLTKNPIKIDEEEGGGVVPESVKLVWLFPNFSVRKDVTADNFKDKKAISKVLDRGIQKVLLDRLEEFGNDSKKAFSDLEKNPIWFNREKGIQVKRVAIRGVRNAEPIHSKRDHFGNEILKEDGDPIPSSFVATGNNHHIAIYTDENDTLQERVVTFFEAVQLANAGFPIIDKHYNQDLGWTFKYSMMQNEMFVFPNPEAGFDPASINLLDESNYSIISPNLFRVQKLSSKNYFFRHHIETTVENIPELKDIAYRNIQSLGRLSGIIKVRINHVGRIVEVI